MGYSQICLLFTLCCQRPAVLVDTENLYLELVSQPYLDCQQLQPWMVIFRHLQQGKVKSSSSLECNGLYAHVLCSMPNTGSGNVWDVRDFVQSTSSLLLRLQLTLFCKQLLSHHHLFSHLDQSLLLHPLRFPQEVLHPLIKRLSCHSHLLLLSFLQQLYSDFIYLFF